MFSGDHSINETFITGRNAKIDTPKILPSGYYYGATMVTPDYEAIDTEGNVVTDIVSL